MSGKLVTYGMGVVCGLVSLLAAPAAAERITQDLTLQEAIQRVLARNETLQIRLLEMEITRRKYRAERGIFEPELVLGYDYQESRRETTSQDFQSTLPDTTGGRLNEINERNNLYNAGLEALIPTGARIRLGYTLRDLVNNYQPTRGFTNGEYVAFAGLNVTQPLLKNAGMPATMANIRLAAVTSEIAYQEYRRQLMQLLSTAEAAYWNLYLAQEQMISLRQSVALAESILKDNETRLKVGRGSELEVLEAQAGLALRRSKQTEARQLFYEAVNRLNSLYSDSIISTNKLVIAVDEPEVGEVPLDFFAGWQSAFDWNPDYLIRRKQIAADNIRLAYAQNQRLPQLDLKGSYGLNGLGDTFKETWDDIGRGGFTSWSVGLEMHIPLGGGTKGRNDYHAARLKLKQTLISLKELEIQIANALDTSLHKARGARDDVANYQTVVAFNENLLQTRLAQLKAGKVESRKVLEVEADLLEARISLAQAKVKYQRALLELDLLQGSLLKSLHVEVSRRDLEQRTARLVKQGDISDAQYDHFLKEVQMAYEAKRPAMNPTAEINARQLLREANAAMQGRRVRPITPEEEQRARELLRRMTEGAEETPFK